MDLTEMVWSCVTPLRFLVHNIRSAVFFRFDLDSEHSDIAFWRELNLGWYEMQGDPWEPFAYLLSDPQDNDTTQPDGGDV
jgi:hypothetical protein